MIKFVNVNKTLWNIVKKENEKFLFNTNLNISLAISKKFEIVKDLVDFMNENVRGFGRWYETLLKSYYKSNFDAQIILDSVEDFIKYSTKYVDLQKVDFSSFIDKKKISKTSIVFYEEDLKSIAISSTCLKLYAVISASQYSDIPYDPKTGEFEDNFSSLIQLPGNVHYEVFNQLIKGCLKLGVHDKIFEVIRSKTYRFYISDKAMWKIIENIYSETHESYIISLFNFLMEKLFPILETGKNPISFLVGYINDSVRWMLKDVYRDQIFYGESFGGMDDIKGGGADKNTFSILCNNDLIEKSSKAAVRMLKSEYNLTDSCIDKIYGKIESTGTIYSYMKIITIPLFKNIMDIPYGHLLTIPPKHSVLIGVFLDYLAMGILDDYPIVRDFLMSYPSADVKDESFMNTKSLYKIKYPEFIINSKELFGSNTIFGFSGITVRMRILSSYCGVLNSCRRKVKHLITEKPFEKLQSYDLEREICMFFTKLYSGKLEDKFSEMRQKSSLYL